MTMIPGIKMNNGVEIPRLGFGVFQISPSQTTGTVRVALDAGFRHIDTAQAYGNEAEVGRAVIESGLPREEVFLTTKLHPQRHGYDAAIVELEQSLRRLRTAYVDLYLLHWPSPGKEAYLDSWRACEKLLADRKVRAIGVSNLTVAHLDWLASRTETVPALNQVELHPNLQQAELRRYHASHGILTEAWGAIAQGQTLNDAALKALAEKYGKTTAQVALRWQIQLGNITLTSSSRPARIKESVDLFDFELEADEMSELAKLDDAPGGAPSRTSGASLPRWQP